MSALPEKPLAVLCKSVEEDLQSFQRLIDAKKAALKKNSGARGGAATNFFL